MATVGAPLNIGTLPYTCYPSDPQSFYADMFSRARALYPQITGVLIQDGTPAASDRDKLWIKTSGGAPVVGVSGQYIFFGGAWVWPHSIGAGSPLRWLWLEDLTALQTFDGGDTNPAGSASGPMWEEDTTFQGRSPMGPGTIPDDGSVLGVDGTYGVGNHALESSEIFNLATHGHVFGRFSQTTNDDGNFVIGTTTAPYPGATGLNGRVVTGDTGAAVTGPLSGHSGEYMNTSQTYDPSSSVATANVTNAAHPNVHPVRGIYIIKRSSRIYYLG